MSQQTSTTCSSQGRPNGDLPLRASPTAEEQAPKYGSEPPASLKTRRGVTFTKNVSRMSYLPMDTERYDYDETGINDRVWLNAVGVIGMIPMNDPGSQTKKIFPKSPYPPREAPRTCPLRAVFADKLLAVSGGVVLAAGLVWYLL